MRFIDAHCHLANLAEILPLTPLLDEAEQQGIFRFVSSALRKGEVSWYKANPDPRILFSAGIHPNFELCDLDLKTINDLCAEKSIWAIGEIGLDNGNPELAWQRMMFKSQLDLAGDYRLPVVLHIVGHQSEAYQTLKQYPLKYLVHGYAGSEEGFRQLSRLDTAFTISERVLAPDKLELLTAMLKHKRILFETDITQYYVHKGESNPLLRLLSVVAKCSELSGLSVDNLLAMQNASAKWLLPAT
jgi:TatD DNase family protein